MNKYELRSRITIRWKGYSAYKVTIEYRGKFYSCTSHNSLAYDRIGCENVSDKSVYGLYTYKGALQTLWDECKRKNNLV